MKILQSIIAALSGVKTYLLSFATMISGLLVMCKVVPTPEMADQGVKIGIEFISQLIGFFTILLGAVAWCMRLAVKKSVSEQ